MWKYVRSSSVSSGEIKCENILRSSSEKLWKYVRSSSDITFPRHQNHQYTLFHLPTPWGFHKKDGWILNYCFHIISNNIFLLFVCNGVKMAEPQTDSMQNQGRGPGFPEILIKFKFWEFNHHPYHYHHLHHYCQLHCYHQLHHPSCYHHHSYHTWTVLTIPVFLQYPCKIIPGQFWRSVQKVGSFFVQSFRFFHWMWTSDNMRPKTSGEWCWCWCWC